MTMSATDTAPPPGPYAAAATTYWNHGWRGPLPLPAGRKHPVPDGRTGAHGLDPSYPDLHAWLDGPEAAGNIALRLPADIIGIDVDAYNDKPAALVLGHHENTLGTLPPTWRSTSRDDGVSGIRLYRVPEGLHWPGGLGPGIDLLRRGHRYAVVWPSIHPSGGTYRWINPDGVVTAAAIPHVDDIPDLPQAWVAHFTGGVLATDQPASDLTTTQVHAWVTTHGEGTPCTRMERVLTEALAGFPAATSRHDHALTATNRILWVAAAGHRGLTHALTQLRAAFLTATAGDRAAGDAAAEWDRLVAGGVAKADAAHPTIPDTDPCDPGAGLIPKDAPCTINSSPASPPAASATTSPTSAEPSTPSPAPSPAATTGSESPTTESLGNAAATAPTSATEPGDYDVDAANSYYRSEIAKLVGQAHARRWFDQNRSGEVIADRLARRLLEDQVNDEYRRATEPPAPPFDLATLGEVLQRDPEPPARIADLMPWSGSTLIVAQRKTGKTTLALNIAHSLLTGQPLLGGFDVIALEPRQKVALLNYEVTAAKVGAWGEDLGIDRDRLVVVTLRGRRNPLGHPVDRLELARLLADQNVASLIVDPFGRAYTGESQNDNSEVQNYLIGLDTFAREEIGATDLILTAHAGWAGEKVRGASALEDWADSLIYLTAEEKDGERRRFFRALGRDVEVDEDELVMDPISRHMTLAGTGGRTSPAPATRRGDETAGLVVRTVNNHDGTFSMSGLLAAITAQGGQKVGKQTIQKALRKTSDLGSIVMHEGVEARGGHVIHRRDVGCEHCPQTTTGPTGPDRSRTGGGRPVPGPYEVGPGPVHSDGSDSETDRTGQNGTVERVIAGQRVQIDLTTGEVVD